MITLDLANGWHLRIVATGPGLNIAGRLPINLATLRTTKERTAGSTTTGSGNEVTSTPLPQCGVAGSKGDHVWPVLR
jgi:hypothetical protein